MSWFPWGLWSFHFILECGERVRPESLEIASEQGESSRIEFVYSPCAHRAVRDQARILEHTQVLRDRGPADGKPMSEHADRAGDGEQALDYHPARRIAEGIQLDSMVSMHLP